MTLFKTLIYRACDNQVKAVPFKWHERRSSYFTVFNIQLKHILHENYYRNIIFWGQTI